MALSDKGIQRMAAAGARLRVRSALNPVLWLCPIVLLPCLAVASYAETPTWLRVVAVILGSAPIVVALWAFAHFVRTDPRRLQSEDYQIRERLLESIQESGEKGRLLDDPHSLEVVLNPQHRPTNRRQEDE